MLCTNIKETIILRINHKSWKKSFSLKQKYVCKINRDKYTILS